MLTGMQHIKEERLEQIQKHGWDVSHDADYGNGELVQAALFCLSPGTFHWPTGWQEHFKQKILHKDRVNQLRVAGAFFLAEQDRSAEYYGDIVNKIAEQIDAIQFSENAKNVKM